MSRERSSDGAVNGARIALIAAMAENRVIGANNALPWRLPADLKHFRRMTTGHHVVMGRKNYESLGKPLRDRINIVVTRNSAFSAPGCLVVHSLAAALAAAAHDPEIFIIGGAELYRQTLTRADRMYLTLVHADVPGDTHFPTFDWGAWRELSRERFEGDHDHRYPFSFVTLERLKA